MALRWPLLVGLRIPFPPGFFVPIIRSYSCSPRTASPMNDKHDLASTLSGHFPLVTIQSHEETRALALLLEIAREQGRPLLTWSVTDGLRRDRHAAGGGIDWKSVTFHGQRDTPVRESADSPERMLRDLQRAGDRPIVALLDFHPYLNEPRICLLYTSDAADDFAVV